MYAGWAFVVYFSCFILVLALCVIDWVDYPSFLPRCM